ncbi:MAG TPA: PKD domain-containing protein [Acidimicrobiales bacterium]|nr:PKD domain-containing protein [Acidimicrobiales bacterium]
MPLPKLTLRFDPSTEGLTQLPTWFWVPNMDTNFEVGPVGVDGYAVTVSLHPVSYHWTFGDGASANSTKPGSGANAEAASVVHTYHETGTYRVGLTVSWAGSYTFTGNGAAQTTSLGPVQQAEVYRNYVVQQVRSVPLNP